MTTRKSKAYKQGRKDGGIAVENPRSLPADYASDPGGHLFRRSKDHGSLAKFLGVKWAMVDAAGDLHDEAIEALADYSSGFHDAHGRRGGAS